ncbi:AAA family ATPase [Rheinheimera texasensis]|uniref:AAA family ATPase n=1 Tax=Rheinheimera texasensis TaxID=306205 RepID=UPI000AD80872|nr:AAA family ATPase [Rheinheimera texasensis]
MVKRHKQAGIPAPYMTPKSSKTAMGEKIEAVTGIKPDNSVLSALEKDQTENLHQLVDQLTESKKHYEAELQAITEARAQADILKASLDAEKLKLEALISEHNQSSKETQEIRAALLKKEKDLLRKAEELLAREAEAEAGFITQHSQSLAILTAELSKVRADHMQSLAKSQSEFLQAANMEEEQLRSLSADFLAASQTIQQTKFELEKAKAELISHEAELSAKESLLETTVQTRKAQLEQQFSQQIAELESEIGRLKSYRKRDEVNVLDLKTRLMDFSELERALKQKGMESAEELLLHVEKIESAMREYRQKLSGRPVEDLEDEVEHLRDLNRSFEEQLRDAKQELNEANAERHKRAIGIMERENLMMKNRVLQQHNDAISIATAQLKQEIDELKDRQQGQAVFPALTRMDTIYNESPSTQPVGSLTEFVDELQLRIFRSDRNNPLYFDKETLQLFLGGLAMSQLHIFQGISGTGKTTLAKAFASAVGGHCTVVPVQAGWRDRDDLVGHYNAFEKRYYEKECLQALYRAQTPTYQDRLNIILLDEMNLSRPEQYFAEFLSAMELSGEDRQVVLMEDSPAKTPRYLREGRKIPVADNVWFIGTANHDETTFEFADKTQDRSFVLELGRNCMQQLPSTLKRQVIYSVSSLRVSFQSAITSHRAEVDNVFKTLYEHELTTVLEKRFGIGWGNRLERQARQFLPVVVAAGGSMSQALDHLLSVRLFRDGKITGRYDTKPEHLSELQGNLNSVWERLFKADMAFKCEDRIERELERKEIA